MDQTNKFNRSLGRVFYTILTAVVICVVTVVMLGYIYRFSEEEAFEKLHMETRGIKNDINLQMISDRENLTTMANFASKLYSDGESFDLLFQSFEEIGLIKDIGILVPGNNLITKMGITNIGETLSFEEEMQKGEYISGRISDMTIEEREIIRSAVPIKVGEEVVAVLYGLIELAELEEKYAPQAEELGAQLYVVESANGNYVIDTGNDKLGKVTALASTKFKDGFSYELMSKQLSNGESGYSAYKARNENKYLYVHYAPLDFADWQIMLAKPERVVFAGARATGKYLIFMLIIVVLIMIIYIMFIFDAERKRFKVSRGAANIRKSLLVITQQSYSINEALKDITLFAKAKAAFFVDTYGEDYNYVVPGHEKRTLVGEDRSYFINELFNYSATHRNVYGVSVHIIDLVTKNLKKESPKFCEFLEKHNIRRVSFAAISGNNSSMSLLGVINPQAKDVDILFREIAVCFSIAIYNKKHLAKTEVIALTDSLTGVMNRMAYKQDIKLIKKEDISNIAFIYIDVNELHAFNDRYGHAAGDQMLLYVAEVMDDEFKDSKVYRMGGDEFLIIVKNIVKSEIDTKLRNANILIEEMKYHISIGVAYGSEGEDIESIFKLAEKRMYEEKSRYYQHKELQKTMHTPNRQVNTVTTGIKGVDTLLTLMQTKYLGVYLVAFEEDLAEYVLQTSYFSVLSADEEKFSDKIKKYVHEYVKPEYHRVFSSFMNYDALSEQLKEDNTPTLTYTKIDGEKVRLCVYPDLLSNNPKASVWVFESEDF